LYPGPPVLAPALKCRVSPTFRCMPKVPSSPSSSSPAATPDTGALPASYEAGLQELEQLVTELE